MSMDLANDERWHRLHDREWQCPCCGMRHGGLFDLVCNTPDYWDGPAEPEPNSAVGRRRNILTDDFCVLDGEHYFIRCVLEMPIRGAPDERFGFGVWSTLSKANFQAYLDTFDDGDQGGLGPWFGWFSNQLKGYPDTVGLKCQVHPRNGRQRPLIELEQDGHPLALAQVRGLSFDRILDIYALNGHDIREAVTRPR